MSAGKAFQMDGAATEKVRIICQIVIWLYLDLCAKALMFSYTVAVLRGSCSVVGRPGFRFSIVFYFVILVSF